MENCAKCSIPLKWYFQTDLSAKSFEVCHGECMTDSINAFVLAIDRILPSSSDKRSPKLGWYICDNFTFCLFIVTIEVKLYICSHQSIYK